MQKLGCFLALMCIFAAIPAYADKDFTIFGAAQHQGKLTLESASSTATGVTNFNPGTFGLVGVRFQHGKVVGGEHTFAYTPHFLNGDARAILSNSNLFVQAPLPTAEPYVTAGVGWIYSFGPEVNGLPGLAKIGVRFAANYGGGIKIFPAGPVGFRFDIRGYTIPGAQFNLPAINALQTVSSKGENLNILEAGIGIVFKIGK